MIYNLIVKTSNLLMFFMDFTNFQLKYARIPDFIWPPSLNELTPIISNMELTHLDLKAFIYILQNHTVQFIKKSFDLGYILR